jgi:hypothetical protein
VSNRQNAPPVTGSPSSSPISSPPPGLRGRIAAQPLRHVGFRHAVPAGIRDRQIQPAAARPADHSGRPPRNEADSQTPRTSLRCLTSVIGPHSKAADSLRVIGNTSSTRRRRLVADHARRRLGGSALWRTGSATRLRSGNARRALEEVGDRARNCGNSRHRGWHGVPASWRHRVPRGAVACGAARRRPGHRGARRAMGRRRALRPRAWRAPVVPCRGGVRSWTTSPASIPSTGCCWRPGIRPAFPLPSGATMLA